MTDHQIIDTRHVRTRDGRWRAYTTDGYTAESDTLWGCDLVIASARRRAAMEAEGTPLSKTAIAELALRRADEPDLQMREYLGVVLAKLERGRVEYGDGSLRRAADSLFAELEEEAVDLGGWSWVLLCAHPSERARAEQLLHEGYAAWRMIRRQREGAPHGAAREGSLR